MAFGIEVGDKFLKFLYFALQIRCMLRSTVFKACVVSAT